MPKVDSNGNTIFCDKCSLHLIGKFIIKIGYIDSTGTSIHADKSNKGIIMALGNVGVYLDTTKINTYLSIDGVKIIKIREEILQKLDKEAIYLKLEIMEELLLCVEMMN